MDTSPVSLWQHASAPRPAGLSGALAGDASADVAIIGAGFTGISAALDLARAGRKVVVLEQAKVGWEASGRCGGLACTGWRRGQDWFEDTLGDDAADALWRLAEEAKADLKTRIAGQDVEWGEGLIFAAHTPAALRALDADASHLERRHGFAAQERLDRADTARALGTDVYHGAWRDSSAGRLHPMKLLHVMTAEALAAGATIHEDTKALAIETIAGGGLVRLAGGGRVRAGHVLVCGDGALAGLEPWIEARVMPIGSFVLTTEVLPPGSGVLPGGEGAMDTRYVVNYWRPTADGRIVFGGGEKYTPDWPKDVAAFVRRNLLKVYPALRDVRIVSAWGGRLGITPTRLPLVAEVMPRVVCAAGYSGQGVVLAPFFGRLLAAAVTGREDGRMDALCALPVPPFPGGRALRWPLLTAAMSWFALRDRIG